MCLSWGCDTEDIETFSWQVLNILSGMFSQNIKDPNIQCNAFHRIPPDVVKLHSDLRILTQLQLVGVGVDFVFQRKKKEGRRKKKNPHLAFSIRNDPTCLNFGDCLWVSGGCMEIVWRVSGGCLTGVLWLSGGCLKGVWKVS